VTAGVGTTRVAAGTWAVSDSRTRVGFTVANLGRTVRGSVPCAQGEVVVDATGAPVRVRAELDLAALDTGIARRDADLRRPRFLDSDRHPTMTWSADRLVPGPDGSWTAEGTLHVRGTTAPLVVTGRVTAVDPGGAEVRVRATAVLDRTAVDIRAPAVLVGRLVRIEIDARLVPARYR
jgi:polyisoprenoid-binding protein YceI